LLVYCEISAGQHLLTWQWKIFTLVCRGDQSNSLVCVDYCLCILQVLEGKVTEDNLDAIIRSIAETLGVDPSLIEISGFSTRRQPSRRAPVSITFKLFVDAEKQKEISALIESGAFSDILAKKLNKQDITASVVSSGTVPPHVMRRFDVHRIQHGLSFSRLCAH